MKYLFVAFFLAITFNSSCDGPAVSGEELNEVPPNVLFIAVDDLNNLLGALDGFVQAKTPNIDRLAARGVLFSDAHCQAPLCGPSRASIMTGLRPSTTGIYGMISDDKIRSDNPATRDIILLPEYFSQNGYYTMGIGKLFHDHAPKDVFDESGGRYKGFGPLPSERLVWDGYGHSDRNRYGRTSTDWGAFPEVDSLMPDHQSADWVNERLGRSYDQPFFLGLGLLRVHVPLYVPQKWFDLYPLDEITTPAYRADDLNDVPPVALEMNDLPMMPSTEWAIESGEWPKIIQAYLACISFVDYEIGRVLDALEQSEHADNTVIVLWSDHGYRLGEKGTFAKHALWDVATRAPLLFAAPNLPEGKVVREPAEMLSIYPTLLELCGLPAYPRNEGKSLVPLMQGTDNELNMALTTFGRNNHAVKLDSFRYISYEDGAEEFYDHRKDPDEFVNQADNPDYEKDILRLRKYVPTTNANWDKDSKYTFQPYFVEQKSRGNIIMEPEMGAANLHQFTNKDLSGMLALREKTRTGQAGIQEPYQALLSRADELLDARIETVIDKRTTPPSGDKHDYLSLAPYWWPDPDSANGLPWIRKDGEINPTTRGTNTDKVAIRNTFEAIEDLALAAWLSGNEDYAKNSVARLDAWFLDPATRMNPNLNFAQGIPGINNGRCFGIIEFNGVQRIINALELLEHGGMLPQTTQQGMHTWLTDLLHWHQTSELGIEESTRANNHGTWYDVQVVSMLRYLNRPDEAKQLLEIVKSNRIANQIDGEGKQPHELARTKSLGYSLFNLKGLTKLAWHGRKVGVDLWGYKANDGSSIPSAYAYLKPYAFDGKPWPYEQLGDKTKYLKDVRQLFHEAGTMMNFSEFCDLLPEEEKAALNLYQLANSCHGI